MVVKVNEVVLSSFQKILEELLGKTTLTVTCFHLKKTLNVQSDEEVLDILLNEPRRIYDALSIALGGEGGVEVLIKLTCLRLYKVKGIYVPYLTVLKALKENDGELLDTIFTSISRHTRSV